MESVDYTAFFGNLLLTLTPAAGAVVVGLRATGRRRVLGVLGCVVSAVVGLGWVGWQFAVNGLDGPGNGTIISLGSLLLTLGQCIGIALLVIAVVLPEPKIGPPTSDPYGFPPGPATYSGPWSQP